MMSADYKPKTNSVIFLDMSHTLRGQCIQELLEMEGK